jgi:hypothetical protein
MSARLRLSLLGAALASALVSGIAWLLSLRPNADELRVGDARATVIRVLGEPAAEVRSRAELTATDFAHFGFDGLTDDAGRRHGADDLPDVTGRALWFPFFSTAGTLVYLDEDDRVSAVFSAGT